MALTTDTSVAVDAFMEGETVTTPIVVMMLAADKEFEVVIDARAAIAPEPLTVVTDAVPEVLEVEVAPDVVDLITGATTAVTTVDVVLEVLDPNPATELAEFDVVLPTAATTDFDDVITGDSDAVERATVDDDKDPEETAGCDCEMTAEARDEVCGALVTGPDGEIVSTAEVFESVDTGPVMPYGLGAKQHIICALDEDLGPLSATSSCLSMATRTVDVFPAEDTELDVTATVPDSSTVSLPVDLATTTPSTLSAGCCTVWTMSVAGVGPLGVHMSKPKQPIFAEMSWMPSPMVSSSDWDPGLPLALDVLSAASKEHSSGVEMI